MEAAEAALGRVGLSIERITPDYSAKGSENLVDGIFSAMDTPAHVAHNVSSGDRVDEVFSIVNKHSARHGCWIAIDDLNLPWRNPRLTREHFVRTNDDLGLTPEKADEAVAKLVALHTGVPLPSEPTWNTAWDAAWALIDNGRIGDAVENELVVPRRRLVRFGGDESDFRREYAVTREVGRGGYGTVRLATHAVTWQQRAVKRDARAANPFRRLRFGSCRASESCGLRQKSWRPQTER